MAARKNAATVDDDVEQSLRDYESRLDRIVGAVRAADQVDSEEGLRAVLEEIEGLADLDEDFEDENFEGEDFED